MKKALWIAGAFFFLAGVAQAQPLRGGLTGLHWWENSRVQSALNLSSDQVKRIRQIVDTKRDQLLDLFFAMKQKGIDLQREIRRSSFDPQRARIAAEAFQKARGDFQREVLNTWLEIREVLTQEQVLKLDRLRRWKRMARFHRAWERKLHGPKGYPGP